MIKSNAILEEIKHLYNEAKDLALYFYSVAERTVIPERAQDFRNAAQEIERTIEERYKGIIHGKNES